MLQFQSLFRSPFYTLACCRVSVLQLSAGYSMSKGDDKGQRLADVIISHRLRLSGIIVCIMRRKLFPVQCNSECFLQTNINTKVLMIFVSEGAARLKH
jgi:hypothetical protein